ncbi:MAG: (E)-4-hydroxy-3-methylbut-2-enyl-diphosphate synthase [Flavobacteriales bacterium]|nr:(E)-4-hydroxy-3-methylbut-2-enyl-diphosphate synthase [Flavobacteriales bacterium]
METLELYCVSPYRYERFQTREVMIGKIGFGAENPIRLQSMTTTDTMDTSGTVAQSIRMIDAGCELVRITAPSKKEAQNLEVIKQDLISKGYDAPLVADIHFTPNAAEIAADYVEKVRVNPGNYADKKKFEEIDYTDESYLAELDRIRTRFTPLVLKCKELGRAMRIGTNHGSLSDRILSRYGDTPLGMVESAMEFLRICRDHDYHDIVISMKASNTQVMVQAYRLLVKVMLEEGMEYPMHLGVTEAGDGEDGRIKSAVGIGTLLEDGIGDTIRVSLTEEPEAEIPVARMLAERYSNRAGHEPIEEVPSAINPFDYHRRYSHQVGNFGKPEVPRVIVDLSNKEEIKAANLFGAGYMYSVSLDKWNMTDQACDYIYTGDQALDFEIPGTLGVIMNASAWQDTERVRHYPVWKCEDYFSASRKHPLLNLVEVSIHDLTEATLEQFKGDASLVIVLTTANTHGMAEQRAAFFKLMHAGITAPVVINRTYETLDVDHFQLYGPTDAGALLLDGLGDGVWFTAPGIPLQVVNSTTFGTLQATRTRISKTEYISCPSCGRTLFDLQETTAKIRTATSHLKGIKIGIMGCIVNGPGEMADADYGYVGTGPGKISLYKEKEVVQKNVPEDSAVEALVELIRTHGDWVEPAQH